jgi:hypothetical protein
MKRTLFAAILIFLSSGALAQTSIPQEIRGYNSIRINFSKGAESCNIKDATPYEERVRADLSNIGLAQSDASVVHVVAAITAQSFGMLGARCTSYTVLAFQTMLGADNIVTDNDAVRRAIDRLQWFPVVLWQAGMFGVQLQTQPSTGGESKDASKAVLGMIDELVKRFDAERR